MDIFSFLCLTYRRRRRAAAATERAGGGLRAHRSVMLPNEAPDIERESERAGGREGEDGTCSLARPKLKENVRES